MKSTLAPVRFAALPFLIAFASHANAQTAACDVATFAKLGLPATRIVSATTVTDEMRVPANWNGGYVDQLNGGNDGAVVPAYGMLPGGMPDTALARGYAVLSSDSGHDGQ